jgi:hypothetical protein
MADDTQNIQEETSIAAERLDRFHPDIFTPREAAAYLRLTSVRGLDTLREQFHLAGYRVGQRFLYWRTDLDECALRIFGRPVPMTVTSQRPKARP